MQKLDGYLRVKEAAEYLGVSPNTLRNWGRNGKIPERRHPVNGYTTGEVSVWRDTLNYFDAIRVGLTATPAAHTKAYFKDVVYRYEYERAVREGHLVDYDAVTVKSDVRMNGVFLNEGEEVDIVDPDSGAETRDSLEDERQFDSSEVERKVTSPDSNRKVVLELKKYADEHEERTGRFPKTLIFAANDVPHTSHAD